MLTIHIERFGYGLDSTLGKLTLSGDDPWSCFIVEDEGRLTKVKGETAIPTGHYEVKLRKHSAKFDKYYESLTFTVACFTFKTCLTSNTCTSTSATKRSTLKAVFCLTLCRSLYRMASSPARPLSPLTSPSTNGALRHTITTRRSP